MTIYERALEMIPEGQTIGLGSGRASMEFIRLLGKKYQQGFRVRGVILKRARAAPVNCARRI